METVLSVWRQKQTVSESEHAQAKEKAHGAQGNACASCGITMNNGGVGIAFVDSNPNNLNESNVRAVCKLCETLLKGGRLNKAHTGGFLVYMPDLTQKELICLMSAYFSLKVDDLNKASVLQTIQFDELKAIRRIAEKYIGFSELSSMQELLRSMTDEVYAQRSKALGPIRWFPDIEDDVLRESLRKYKDNGYLSINDVEEMSKEL